MTTATITIYMYMRKPHIKLRTYLTSMSNIKAHNRDKNDEMREKEKVRKCLKGFLKLNKKNTQEKSCH